MQRFTQMLLRPVALAVATLVFTVAPALAQHGGNHHGGGGGDHHGGGGYYHGGGDYHQGGGDYHHNDFGFGFYGFYPGIYLNLGSRGYYGDYRYGYGWTPGDVPPAEMPATIVVHVPADAKVWFDGNLTQSGGESRAFNTPPLSVDQVYHYDIRAQWTEGGQTVDRSQRVDFQPGRSVVVDFAR